MDRHFHELTVAIASAGLSFIAFSVMFAPSNRDQGVPASIEVVEPTDAIKVVNK